MKIHLKVFLYFYVYLKNYLKIFHPRKNIIIEAQKLMFLNVFAALKDDWHENAKNWRIVKLFFFFIVLGSRGEVVENEGTWWRTTEEKREEKVSSGTWNFHYIFNALFDFFFLSLLFVVCLYIQFSCVCLLHSRTFWVFVCVIFLSSNKKINIFQWILN